MIYLLHNDSTINGIDSIIFILRGDTAITRQMELFKFYCSKEDYSNARIILNNLSSNTALTNFCRMSNLVVNLRSQNRDISEILSDSASRATVYTISEDTVHAGYADARAIISLLTGKIYPEIINFNPSRQNLRHKKENIDFINGIKLLRNYPNPFNESTTIEVVVNDNLKSPELRIIDYTGKIILTQLLHTGFNSLKINSVQLVAGIYFYSLLSENKVIQTEKMILIQ